MSGTSILADSDQRACRVRTGTWQPTGTHWHCLSLSASVRQASALPTQLVTQLVSCDSATDSRVKTQLVTQVPELSFNFQ